MAAVLALISAVLFALAATLQQLGQATSWALLGLVGFGFIAFLIQQLSLATGQLAPAMRPCRCRTRA